MYAGLTVQNLGSCIEVLAESASSVQLRALLCFFFFFFICSALHDGLAGVIVSLLCVVVPKLHCHRGTASSRAGFTK